MEERGCVTDPLCMGLRMCACVFGYATGVFVFMSWFPCMHICVKVLVGHVPNHALCLSHTSARMETMHSVFLTHTHSSTATLVRLWNTDALLLH